MEAIRRMDETDPERIVEFFKGEEPKHIASPEDLKAFRKKAT